ncbi:MAG: hypothetical protein WDZ51_13720 [Pirellulaceae bacterium]
MNKIATLLVLGSLILGSAGCSMCSHPFDYSYAAHDEAHNYGHRAGSAFSPVSTTTVHDESVLESDMNGESVLESVEY